MSPLERVMELVAYGWIGECKHHQKEAQDYPGDDDCGKGDLCQLLGVLLRSRVMETHGRQAMDIFTSAHSDEENQPDGSRNAAAGVH